MTTQPGPSSGSGALANLTAGTASASPMLPGKGPTNGQALGGNYLAGGKAPLVYWGQTSFVRQRNTSGRDSVRDDMQLPPNHAPDGTKQFQEAIQDWYNWSDAERSSFGQRLYKLGLVRDPNDYQAVYSVWTNAVQEASNFYTVAKKKITPWQVVDLLGGLAGTGGQSKTTSNTSTSFNIPTVDDARAAASSVTQALLGRDPDKNEQSRLASILTSYAQKHPQVTKSTQTTDAQGNSTSSSTSSGGYTAAGMQQVLKDKVQADPEYGAYQAATTYMGALMQAIGGTGA